MGKSDCLWNCPFSQKKCHSWRHGDLAARNILLNENLDAKIADFGLSRELVQDNIYVKKTDQPIPWKWMALESFRTHEFSYKTDVWAYGITLWEVFSLGASAYVNIPCNAAFVLGLNNGNRLPSPEFASSQLYEILLSTWNSNPEPRPTFEHLVKNNVSFPLCRLGIGK